ncbi:MAG: hypothetical protein HC888_05215 [Candidatus Competibacteraceae bacterium]|nr:hypothetical protein [Candidatus Competibacteraceae bacterium]
MKISRFPAAVITMLDMHMNPAFEVIVYGVRARDLMKVPSPVIHRLAKKYRGYHSSPFHVRDLERKF